MTRERRRCTVWCVGGYLQLGSVMPSANHTGIRGRRQDCSSRLGSLPFLNLLSQRTEWLRTNSDTLKNSLVPLPLQATSMPHWTYNHWLVTACAEDHQRVDVVWSLHWHFSLAYAS